MSQFQWNIKVLLGVLALFREPGDDPRPPTYNNTFSGEHNPQLHTHSNRFRTPCSPLPDTHNSVHRITCNTLLTHNNMFWTLPSPLPNTHNTKFRAPCNPLPDTHNYILQSSYNTQPPTHNNPRRESPIHLPVTIRKIWELRMDSSLSVTMAPLFNTILRRLPHPQSRSL
jgi:hypothetical protein